MLFRRAVCALSAPVRRTITTTPIKRSSDPLIGHVNQEAMPGLVNTFFKLFIEKVMQSLIQFIFLLIFKIEHPNKHKPKPIQSCGHVDCFLWQRFLCSIYHCTIPIKKEEFIDTYGHIIASKSFAKESISERKWK
jgi:hypothetical protein